MPLWSWIERKAKSIRDTLLARRGVAAVIIALVAPLSVMLLVSYGNTVSAGTLMGLATLFCGFTLFITIVVHGSGPVLERICSVISRKPITWNDTVLALITLFQSAYFLWSGYDAFVDAFGPHFDEITASSDTDTVSQIRIRVLSQFVFLTSLTYYWAGMNRMVHVVKSLEETYRNRTEGTIGGLVAKLSRGHQAFDSVLRLSTVVLLLIIQTKLNLSLFSSLDPSDLSTDGIVRQSAATATTIAAAGGYFIMLSMSLLTWDVFVRWHAKKWGLHVPTPLQLHGVALIVSVAHYAFWRSGEAWVSFVPLCGHLAITFVVLLFSWWQLIFIVFAPPMSTLELQERRGVT